MAEQAKTVAESQIRGIPWRDGPPTDDLKDGRRILIASGVVIEWDADHSNWWCEEMSQGVPEILIIRHCPVTL